MNKINMKKTVTGYSVQFPFELKDEFKAVFKTAKWNSALKVWETGQRSEKKLLQWIDAVEKSSVIEELEKRDEEEMCRNELADLEARLAKLASNLGETRRRKESADAMREKMEHTLALIAAEEERLCAERQKADAAEKESSERQKAAMETLKKYIDLKKVVENQRVMISMTGEVGRQEKDKFHAAMMKIREEDEKLAAAGLVSVGIRALAHMNYNRPDRDKPAEITKEMVLTLLKQKNDD